MNLNAASFGTAKVCGVFICNKSGIPNKYAADYFYDLTMSAVEITMSSVDLPSEYLFFTE